jgi:hypothetical protein
MTKAVAAQAALLEGLAATGAPGDRRAGTKELFRLLRAHQAWLPEAYKARVVGPGGAAQQWLSAAVVAFYRATPALAEAFEQGGVKREFMDAYVRDVSGALVAPPASCLPCCPAHA